MIKIHDDERHNDAYKNNLRITGKRLVNFRMKMSFRIRLEGERGRAYMQLKFLKKFFRIKIAKLHLRFNCSLSLMKILQQKKINMNLNSRSLLKRHVYDVQYALRI